MHITNCINPRRIFRNGYEQYVPCGKCEYCRAIRSAALSTKLRYEIQSHKFGVFFTLTYADMFLPKLIYNKFERTVILPKLSRGRDVFFPDCEEFDSFSCHFLDKESVNLLDNRPKVLGCVPCLSRRDVQLFMKRVRINLKRKLNYDSSSQKDYQITYAVCGEYGPTTLRPHYHGVLLFDEQSILSVIFKIIHSSWPYGSSKARILGRDENGGYISKYLNGYTSLPALLKARKIRPFFLASKDHPLGLYQINKEEIQNILSTCSPTVHITDTRTGKPSLIPLWPTLENWFFPKFSGFDRISHRCKLRLLGAALSTSSFKEFVSLMFDCDRDAWRSWFVGPGNFQFDTEYSDYLQLYYKSCSIPPNESSVVESSLRSIYYCASRIRRNMHKYCINSVEEYLDKIYKYYENKESFRLQQQLELEEKIMLHQPELIDCIDLRFFTDAVISSFDIAPILSRFRSDVKHSHKNKVKNEYLVLHPEYSYNCRPDDFSEGFK